VSQVGRVTGRSRTRPSCAAYRAFSSFPNSFQRARRSFPPKYSSPAHDGAHGQTIRPWAETNEASAAAPYRSSMNRRKRPPSRYGAEPRGHSSIGFEATSSEGSPSPSVTSARAYMSKRAFPFRPALPSPSPSWRTASPSMVQEGRRPFGTKIFPNTRFTIAGMPPTVSRWRMWTYSCQTRTATQSRYPFSSERDSGGAA
jgi:hypothetical protein